MKNDVKERLKQGDFTCVIAKGDMILTTNHRGVKPLLDWLEENIDLEGGYAADKVVGKAAACLYVLLKIRFVWAAVISRPALDIFQKYGILCEYETLVDAIVNRTKDGLCPMEQAVWGVETPDDVPALLKDALKKLTEETKYRETLKSMPICQIEDARAEITSAQEVADGELDLEKLRRQMEALDAEKKRRGYK